MEKQNYDNFSISVHWLIAILTIGLFCLGLWMVELNYYDDWYYLGPWWHTGLGVFVALLVLSRLVWRFIRQPLAQINSIPCWQSFIAKLVHGLLELCILTIVLTGYFIVTAKGDAVDVFGWFSVPALILGYDQYVDLAGKIHLWAAYLLIGLVGVHALAALKHHFINRDVTLLRMFGLNKGEF